MNTVQIQSVALKAGGPAARVFETLDHKQQQSPELDHHTLIYDIVVSPCGRHLTILCPAFTDTSVPASLELWLQNRNGLMRPMRLRSTPLERVHILTAKVPRQDASRSGYRVQIKRNDEELLTAKVSPATKRTNQYCLATLQKDNEPEWIYDWALYHHALGIDHLILYDNGSQNLRAVEKALQSLPSSLEVTLINWPFPYGLHPFPKTFLAQTGAIQHALLTNSGAHCILFTDIDEYLVFPEMKEGAFKHLFKTLPPHVGGMRFSSYNVTNMDPEPGLVPRAFHFKHRSTELRDHGYKYAVKPKATKIGRVHGAELKWPFRMRQMPPDTIAFLHFLALTTGWKSSTWDRQKHDSFDPGRHEQDERVRQMFDRFIRLTGPKHKHAL